MSGRQEPVRTTPNFGNIRRITDHGNRYVGTASSGSWRISPSRARSHEWLGTFARTRVYGDGMTRF